MKTRFLLGLFVYALTIAIVLSAMGFWLLSKEYRRPGPLQQEAFFEVERGSSLSGIAHKLQSENIIFDARVFSLSAVILGQQKNLKAGEYQFLPRMSAGEILYLLRSGKTFERRFTIREGLTSHEIVNILKNLAELEGEISKTPEEGSLLPETYDYRRGEPRERMIGRMQQAMTDTIDALWEGRADNLPFTTKEEAVTLASIVEKETGMPEERKRVAGVFVNRLREGIALQTDPTVIYAITKGVHENEGKGPLGRRLLAKDLEIDSPYNTYKYPGLPPGPIANPGRASIEAVLHPEEHKFFYFVADGTGGHVFAETLGEHNANVSKWRKIRREQKK
jgi:UPF0755 protein